MIKKYGFESGVLSYTFFIEITTLVKFCKKKLKVIQTF